MVIIYKNIDEITPYFTNEILDNRLIDKSKFNNPIFINTYNTHIPINTTYKVRVTSNKPYYLYYYSSNNELIEEELVLIDNMVTLNLSNNQEYVLVNSKLGNSKNNFINIYTISFTIIALIIILGIIVVIKNGGILSLLEEEIKEDNLDDNATSTNVVDTDFTKDEAKINIDEDVDYNKTYNDLFKNN